MKTEELEKRIELLRSWNNGERLQIKILNEWRNVTITLFPKDFFDERNEFRLKKDSYIPYNFTTAPKMMHRTVFNRVLHQTYRIVGYTEKGFIIELLNPDKELTYQDYGYQNALGHLLYEGEPVGVLN